MSTAQPTLSSIITLTPPLKYLPTLLPSLEPPYPPTSNLAYESLTISPSPQTSIPNPLPTDPQKFF